MPRVSRWLIFTILALGAAQGAFAQTIVCDGTALAPGAPLPASVSAAVRASVEKLAPWAGKHGLKLTIGSGDPLIFAAPASFSAAPGILTKLKATREDFEKLLGPVPEGASMEVVYLDKKEALAGYVDLLVERESYLKDWAPSQKDGVGFTLLRPLATAYRREPRERSEARIVNDLIHRYAHLLTNATLGRQPFWLTESLAWVLEQRREGAIYAFCGRSGFVKSKDHGGWPKIGRAWLTAGSTLPLEKVLALNPGTEAPKELTAGAQVLADHLLAKHKAELLACAKGHREAFEAQAATPAAPLPDAKLREVFLAAFGAEAEKSLLEELRAAK